MIKESGEKNIFAKAPNLLFASLAFTSCGVHPTGEHKELVPLVEETYKENSPLKNEDAGQVNNGYYLPLEIEPLGPKYFYGHSPSYDYKPEKSNYALSLSEEGVVVEEETGDGIFNPEVTDIFQWKDMGFDIQQVERYPAGQSVEVVEPTTMFSVGISDNAFVRKDKWGFLEIATLNSGTIEILDKKTIVSENGGSIVLGILPYEGDVASIQAIILEAVDLDGTHMTFVDYKDDFDLQEAKSTSTSNSEKFSAIDEVGAAVDYIYNPEDLTRVEKYILGDEIIESVLDFKDVIDEYPDDSPMLVSDYIKGTEWYNNMIEKLGEETMAKVANAPNSVRIPGQPVQCVAFNRMMAMAYPELNVPEVIATGTGYAKEIVQYIFKPSSEIRENPLWYGPVQISGSSLPVETYQAGDVFVTIGGDYGHTGVILGKYEDDGGQPFLIVADSNRHFNGRIKVFVVDQYNIGKMFGTDYMFIIRGR